MLKLYVGLGLDKIAPTVIHLNYNGNTVHVFESYLNKISKMAVFVFELKSRKAMYLIWLSGICIWS